ncbi:hypothetical protein PENVUL_c004G00762 [Penicillium vulpinum]|uniref:Uncharacterized protein n=1 Tax=Penicillium vulpinum TaxID=29845 RepID=A0A1V6S8X1_9EURO|nr:hypothetical protein PENVUL_c004G00762 [Penicillium vulpinum]
MIARHKFDWWQDVDDTFPIKTLTISISMKLGLLTTNNSAVKATTLVIIPTASSHPETTYVIEAPKPFDLDDLVSLPRRFENLEPVKVSISADLQHIIQVWEPLDLDDLISLPCRFNFSSPPKVPSLADLQHIIQSLESLDLDYLLSLSRHSGFLSAPKVPGSVNIPYVINPLEPVNLEYLTDLPRLFCFAPSGNMEMQ